MKKFRIPRKTKKQLEKTIWLYQPDKKGNSKAAFPIKNKEDFLAWNQGLLRDMFADDESKSQRKEQNKLLDQPINITDEILLKYVEDIFREDYRRKAFNILVEAKKNKNTVRAYYNFVNAYHFDKEGDDSWGNICCLCIDLAEDLLRKEKWKKKKKKARKKRSVSR